MFAALFAVAAAACGGTPFPSAARTTNVRPVVPAPAPAPTTTAPPAPTTGRSMPTTAPTIRARPASHPPTSATIPRPATTEAPTTEPAVPSAPAQLALIGLLPTMDVLGVQWQDQGDPRTSLDLTDPPAPCGAYMPVFDKSTATVLHEYSFLPSADGNFEEGHINVAALRAPSAAMVANELVAVAQPAFAQCAEASAERRFEEVDTGTIHSASAKLISLPLSGAHVIWRASVISRTTDGAAQTTYMDVVYLGAGALLVKARFASCGCHPPEADGELLPGELPALQEIERGLAPTGSG